MTAKYVNFLIPLAVLIIILFTVIRGKKFGGYYQSVCETRTSRSGAAYLWNYAPPSRNRAAKCELSIDADIAFEFTLEHEGKPQQLAEWLGFTNKVMTNDPDFDRQVYIISDDSEFHNKLQNISELRRVVLHLFQAGVKSISSNTKKLTVALKDPAAILDDDTIDSLVHDLNGFKRYMPSSTMMDGQAFQVAPTYQRAKLFKIFSATTLFIGFAGIFINIVQPQQLVHTSELITLTAEAGLSATLFVLCAIMIGFRGSSLGYDVLRIFLTLGLAGVMLCSGVILYSINMWCDNTAPDMTVQPIYSKYMSHGRRNGTSYYVRVADWHLSNTPLKLKVDYNTYMQINPNRDSLKITTHPGWLGLEWVEHYEVVYR